MTMYSQQILLDDLDEEVTLEQIQGLRWWIIQQLIFNDKGELI
jgi:hypothetical protein